MFATFLEHASNSMLAVKITEVTKLEMRITYNENDSYELSDCWGQ